VLPIGIRDRSCLIRARFELKDPHVGGFACEPYRQKRIFYLQRDAVNNRFCFTLYAIGLPALFAANCRRHAAPTQLSSRRYARLPERLPHLLRQRADGGSAALQCLQKNVASSRRLSAGGHAVSGGGSSSTSATRRLRDLQGKRRALRPRRRRPIRAAPRLSSSSCSPARRSPSCVRMRPD